MEELELNDSEQTLSRDFLDKLYEMTGNESGELSGYALFFATSKGNINIARESGSQVTQFALDYAIDNYEKITSEGWDEHQEDENE